MLVSSRLYLLILSASGTGGGEMHKHKNKPLLFSRCQQMNKCLHMDYIIEVNSQNLSGRVGKPSDFTEGVHFSSVAHVCLTLLHYVSSST